MLRNTSPLFLYAIVLKPRLRQRNTAGAVLILCIALLFVFISLAAYSVRLGELFFIHQKQQEALEAAALQAASDLSEIVIDDPHFGFISLSDRPAIGTAMLAQDGEPLPVLGINTIIATSRLNYIIATELGDSELEKLAIQDIQHAREAAARLDAALYKSLQSGGSDNSDQAKDIDGNVVTPYSNALDIYERSLGEFAVSQPQQLELSLGWLKNGGQTSTPIPVDNNSPSAVKRRYLPIGTQIDGFYSAYIDVPVDKQHFAFASLSGSPLIVNSRDFVQRPPACLKNDLAELSSIAEATEFIPDKYNKFISSIVSARAEWVMRFSFPWERKTISVETANRACAQPAAEAIKPAPSILVIAFPDGRPNNIENLADILENNGLKNTTMQIYTPVDGDFPTDPQCSLQIPGDGINNLSANVVFAQTLFDWLRSNYTLPHIDSILDALKQPFPTNGQSSQIGCVFALEITEEGKVVMSNLCLNPFADIRVHENQLYATNSTPAIIDGRSWTVVCRDQVHIMGNSGGGKHAGQTMLGDPINWSELLSCVSSDFASAVVSRKLQGISLVGTPDANGGIALDGSELLCKSGKNLPKNLRKSAYSGGLAAEIRISSPTDNTD